MELVRWKALLGLMSRTTQPPVVAVGRPRWSRFARAPDAELVCAERPGDGEALYEIASLRTFAHLGLGEPIPDETTILNFRHLLEANDLADDIEPAIGATVCEGSRASLPTGATALTWRRRVNSIVTSG